VNTLKPSNPRPLLESGHRGKSEKMAFNNSGDQFIAMAKIDSQSRDYDRHCGLVVDNKKQLVAR